MISADTAPAAPTAGERLAATHSPGDLHHRAFVGPPEKYDLVAAMQFNVLTFQGLREHHYLLDIGCGSLRGGRLFMPYLLPGRYFGIEPEEWLLSEGIREELGREIIDRKQPTFAHHKTFELGVFGRPFDYLLAQSIFSHAGPKDVQRCLLEASKVMLPTSMLLATYVAGERDYEGDAWVYPGCVTYRRARLEEMARSAGLACTHIGWPHPNGQTWVALTFPGHVSQVYVPEDLTRIAWLQNELALQEARLARLQGHPWVRLGRTIRRFLRG
jgi:hypothetical protein